MNTQITTTRPRLEKFFAKVMPVQARIIWAIDATGSRERSWDLSTKLTADMFAAASGVTMQIVYYRGVGEFTVLPWMSDRVALATEMSKVSCRSGTTQIGKVLEHARRENTREKVDALIIISDACEEQPFALYTAARALGDLPTFLFQEGDDPGIHAIYAEIVRIIPRSALASFDSSAAARLADLLKAVVAFASGGMKALEAQNSEAAKLLISGLKR